MENKELEDENYRLRMKLFLCMNTLEQYADERLYVKTDNNWRVFDYAHYLNQPWKLAQETLDKLEPQEEKENYGKEETEKE